LWLGTASSSYLLGQNIIDICVQSGAQAIHPGYGFLSENANFVRQVELYQGLTFIGPPSSAISAMGSKSKSKDIMTKANVPCTPGFIDVDPSSQEPDFLLDQAISHVGFPCLIKATMGK
jgi:3-methylcrotonyl-CoA carboxylase alpha subunit